MYFGGGIFYTLKWRYSYLSRKESFLFNINNSFVGNYQYVQIIVGPNNKKCDPYEKKPCWLAKDIWDPVMCYWRHVV